MNLPKIENLGFIGIITAAVLIFFYFILGVSGMMSALGIILLFIVPLYLILDNFELDQDEKIVFSFFIGVGIFPAIAYWLGMFISFRIAILITFIVLIVVGILVRKLKKKNG
jgi:apolipoprotein N-acyltransferase